MVLKGLVLVVSSTCTSLGMGDSTGLSCSCQGDVGDMSAISLGRSEAAFSMMCWRRLEDQAVAQCSLPSNGLRSCHIRFLSTLGPSLHEAPVALPSGTFLLRGLFLDKLPVVSSCGEQGVAIVKMNLDRQATLL